MIYSHKVRFDFAPFSRSPINLGNSEHPSIIYPSAIQKFNLWKSTILIHF